MHFAVRAWCGSARHVILRVMQQSADLLVRNGIVVTSTGRAARDVAIRDGRFSAMAPPGTLDAAGAEVLDATGLHVLPGVIDGHVHFREPGLTHKEDWGSGSRAAVMGGVTTVLEMPNTLPPTASVETARAKMALAGATSWCDFGIFGLVTDATLDELEPMAAVPGLVGYKAFLGPTTGDLEEPGDAGLMAAMRHIARLGLRLGVHAEDRAIVETGQRVMRETGRRDPLAHVEGRPPEAEIGAITRVARLAAATGCRLHVFHLSTAAGLAAIEEWRDRGVDLTCELTPHHAFLDSRDMERLGSVLRVNPPVRPPGNAEALVRALAAGRIEAIATDHAPHERELKLRDDIHEAVSGFPGVETSLALFLTEGVAAGRLTLEQLVRATSEGPARTWGLWPGKGALAVGSDADLTIVDLARKGTIHGEHLHGRSDTTPWEGWPTVGAPVATIVRGRIVMRDGELLGEPAGRGV